VISSQAEEGSVVTGHKVVLYRNIWVMVSQITLELYEHRANENILLNFFNSPAMVRAMGLVSYLDLVV
jgi:hypothetical protein